MSLPLVRTRSVIALTLVTALGLLTSACGGSTPDAPATAQESVASPSPSEADQGDAGGSQAGVYRGVATLTAFDSVEGASTQAVGDTRDAEINLLGDCDGESPCQLAIGSGFVEILPSPSGPGGTAVGSLLELTPSAAGYTEQATFDRAGPCPIAVTRTTELVLDEGTARLTITIAPETLEKACADGTSFAYGGTVEFEGTQG